jgi:hypothetical protein
MFHQDDKILKYKYIQFKIHMFVHIKHNCDMKKKCYHIFLRSNNYIHKQNDYCKS